MFTTGLSVLEVVVAVVTLFSGGYAGGRGAAIARMRTDDRRRIRDVYLGPLLLAAPRRSLGRARAYYNSWEDITRTVALLPWTDRAAWRRLAEGLERQTEWTSIVEKMPPVGRDKDWADEVVDEQQKDEIRRSFECLDLAAVGAEARRFSKYLDLTLRPSPVRRLKIWRVRWALVSARPRPWPWRV